MTCESCGADLPEGARFCIECGAAVRAAVTGATVALPRAGEAAIPCPHCGAANPVDAVFCVRCGQRMAGGPARPPDLLRDPTTLARPGPSQIPVSPGPAPQRRRKRRLAQIVGPLFLIGLGLILLLKLPFMPMFFFLLGLGALLSQMAQGQLEDGLSGLFVLGGIGLIFAMPRMFWPILLIVIGLNALIHGARHRWWRP